MIFCTPTTNKKSSKQHHNRGGAVTVVTAGASNAANTNTITVGASTTATTTMSSSPTSASSSVSNSLNDVSIQMSITVTPMSSSSSRYNNNSISKTNSGNSCNNTPSASSSSSSSFLLTPKLLQKADEINALLLQPDVDLWKLRELAISEGGLVNDNIRQRAWPKLVGLDHNYEPLPFYEIVDDLVVSNDDDHRRRSLPTSDNLSSSPTQQTVTDNHNHNNKNACTTPRFEIDASELKVHDGPASRLYGTLLVESMDACQIERDVARCTWHLLTGSQRSKRLQYHNKGRNKKIMSLLKRKQKKLANLINLTLVESYGRVHNAKQRLRYYQGYHDVACIFLHALGGGGSSNLTTTTTTATMTNGGGLPPPTPSATTTTIKDDDESTNNNKNNNNNNYYNATMAAGLDLPSKVLCQVSFSHFGDALQSNFLQLQTALKIVLFPLLHTLDPIIHSHLHDADMEPFFCLSWIITWFAHDVRDTDVVKRLFDVFLVSHPLLPVYMALSMMLHPYNRQCILDTDCDFAALHQCLASLPKHSCRVGWKRRREEGMVYVSDDDEPDGQQQPTARYAALQQEAERLQEAIAITKEEHALQREERMKKGLVVGSCSGTQIDEDEYDVVTHNSDGESDWIPLKQTDDRTASTEDLEFYSKSSNSVASTTGLWSSPIKNSLVTAVTSDPVPFEEVISTALQYMTKYPPNSLVDLARRYYQDDWDNQLVLLNHGGNTANSSTLDVQHRIALLRPCPTWAIVPNCTSDWVFKQRLRQTLGLKASSRKHRRRKQKTPNPTVLLLSPTSQSTAVSDSTGMVPSSGQRHSETNISSAVGPNADPMKYVLSNPYNLAVIAVGYGPGLGPEMQLAAAAAAASAKRRRRKRMVGAVVFIGAFAVGAIGVAYHQHRRAPSDASSISTTWMSLFNPSSYNDDETCKVSASPVTVGADDSIMDNNETAAVVMNNAASSNMLPRSDVLERPELQLHPRRTVTISPSRMMTSPITSTNPNNSLNQIPKQLKSTTTTPDSSHSGIATKRSILMQRTGVTVTTTTTSKLFAKYSILNQLAPLVDQWKRSTSTLSVQVRRLATQFVRTMVESFHHVWRVCVKTRFTVQRITRSE